MDKDGLDGGYADDQLGLGLRVNNAGGRGSGSGGGDRRLVEADWSRGLQLSIPTMLLHSSDTQVQPLLYIVPLSYHLPYQHNDHLRWLMSRVYSEQ